MVQHPAAGGVVKASPESAAALPALWVDAERGIIPADLKQCAAILDIGAQFSSRIEPTMWMVVARTSFLFPEDKPSRTSWLNWVQAHYPQYGNRDNIHHIRAVGSFLLTHATGSAGDRYGLRLLDFPKLTCLVMLARAVDSYQFNTFLDKYAEKLPTMSRDQVRKVVNAWTKPHDANLPDPAAATAARPRRPRCVDVLEAITAAATEKADTFQKRAAAWAATVPDGLPVLNRALTLLDVMIPRLDHRHPEAFAVLAKTLRNEATRLERMLADPGILSPVRPLSPPLDSTDPTLCGPDDFVRKILPPGLAGYVLSNGKVIPPPLLEEVRGTAENASAASLTVEDATNDVVSAVMKAIEVVHRLAERLDHRHAESITTVHASLIILAQSILQRQRNNPTPSALPLAPLPAATRGDGDSLFSVAFPEFSSDVKRMR
jgi:hypothetical protein